MDDEQKSCELVADRYPSILGSHRAISLYPSAFGQIYYWQRISQNIMLLSLLRIIFGCVIRLKSVSPNLTLYTY
ncbi:hypothetical protein H6S82_09420 [Planktothrix sp. FACHB-1355]|uniref:Uncharacterized protein n=1 Tax=Aerosakkonema funiforme FACHB-1375 TaxID=2949571 RepID=A0A926ZG42_9CYAN|nr:MULTISPECIES: hypothetical protein [Oscillatoriales]MBD2180712.1 hypothetical protein [Aerosakkonema funiforme FACHB-1375]MBD3559077.1 hypothetical protein [Planktothrix sp. FACHB-1355]